MLLEVSIDKRYNVIQLRIIVYFNIVLLYMKLFYLMHAFPRSVL